MHGLRIIVKPIDLMLRVKSDIIMTLLTVNIRSVTVIKKLTIVFPSLVLF